MIKIIARIKLYNDGKSRKTPFVSGYRPLFNFINNMKTSGKITLLDRDEFYPGEEGNVAITFLNREFLGVISDGQHFTFDEGGENLLGEGTIIEIQF
jgi:translation elongation factor EF-Tu-like GTPase